MNVARLRRRVGRLSRLLNSYASEVRGLRSKTYDLPISVAVDKAARRVGLISSGTLEELISSGTLEECVEAMANELEALRAEVEGLRPLPWEE